MKKIKRSIESMPRPAYIFLKNSLLICNIMLASSLLLFNTAGNGIDSYERFKYAQLMLESPAGILLITIIGFAFILDRS